MRGGSAIDSGIEDVAHLSDAQIIKAAWATGLIRGQPAMIKPVVATQDLFPWCSTPRALIHHDSLAPAPRYPRHPAGGYQPASSETLAPSIVLADCSLPATA